MDLEQSGFVIPLPKGKDWFSPAEAAKAMGISSQQVRNLIKSGFLGAHMIRAKGAKLGFYRIHRSALLLFMTDSATYTSADFLVNMREVLMTRSDIELHSLITLTTEILNGTER